MIGLPSFSRCLAAIGCATVDLAPARAAGLDPAQMSADEIKALEQRLTDADCYKGAIDGTVSAALDAAIKACPDQRPFLRIEIGMHTAPISRIGVDDACRLLATASDDKTVRLWSLLTPALAISPLVSTGVSYLRKNTNATTACRSRIPDWKMWPVLLRAVDLLTSNTPKR